MKFIFERDTWQEIYGAIRKNKIRTIITVIGVTWGVFLFVFLLGWLRAWIIVLEVSLMILQPTRCLFGGNKPVYLTKVLKEGDECNSH